MAEIINKIVECEKTAQQTVHNAQLKQKKMLERLDEELKRAHDKAIADADAAFLESQENFAQAFVSQENELTQRHNRQLLRLKKAFDENRAECTNEIVRRILEEIG